MDSMSYGAITITFYVSDIIGNIGSAEVNVIKGLISPGGLEPGVIIVIIVVTVIGGLAIIGAIWGILVKKGKILLYIFKSLISHQGC